MNFAGHILVASRTGLDEENIDLQSIDPHQEVFLLGSALPDIASMGRVRLVQPLVNPVVDRGVQNHKLADAAFHHNKWFIDRNAELFGRLEGAGLARGPARACAHVSVELFLDGALLASTPGLHAVTQACLQRANDPGLELQTAVKPERRTRWQTHLDRTAAWPLPDDYHQPDAVANRLHRIVDHRPRLAFPPEQISVVEGVLAAYYRELTSGCETLVADVTSEVTTEQRTTS